MEVGPDHADHGPVLPDADEGFEAVLLHHPPDVSHLRARRRRTHHHDHRNPRCSREVLAEAKTKRRDRTISASAGTSASAGGPCPPALVPASCSTTSCASGGRDGRRPWRRMSTPYLGP